MDQQPPVSPTDRRIAAIRAFNRFYTGRIGVVRDRVLASRFTLTEARLLYEIAHTETATAKAIRSSTGIDGGYLSRIVQGFEDGGLIVRTPAPVDARMQILQLTEAGRTAFAPLDQQAKADIAALLAALPDRAQELLVESMHRIETLLGPAAPVGSGSRGWVARPPLPGDIGWVVSRHGALYAQEYGFDARFEALVAQVAGQFLANHDPDRERCWIAERDGVRLGSVFLVRESDDVGRLRLLIVEPAARGLGVGKALVADCIAFARSAGYRRLTLWTNDVLLAARGIYVAAGFHLIASAPHRDFGPEMVGEDWVMDLTAS